MMRTPHPLSDRRRGGVSLFVLLALPVLLTAVGLALYAGGLFGAKTQLQNAADATALAAAGALVDDRGLLHDREAMLAVLEDARREALRYSRANPAGGWATELDVNPNNDEKGDLRFGSLDRPRDRHFIPADVRDRDNPFLHLVNTVQVALVRTRDRKNPVTIPAGSMSPRKHEDVVTRAAAMLDRDVIGFRPVEGIGNVPLAPIALLSDPAGKKEGSWEHEVEKRHGPDRWSFDRDDRRFAPGPDRLHEMHVLLNVPYPGKDKDDDKDKKDKKDKDKDKKDKEDEEKEPSVGLFLQLGIDDSRDVAEQVLDGVTRMQMMNLGGEFLLGEDNTRVTPGRSQLSGSAVRDIVAALEELRRRGEARVWPLYLGVHPKADQPIVSGFVAARVVRVEARDEGGVLLVLQPTMTSTATAVTDADRRGIGGTRLPNPYVCKIRLVE